jgi:hypothetical protein
VDWLLFEIFSELFPSLVANAGPQIIKIRIDIVAKRIGISFLIEPPQLYKIISYKNIFNW